MPKILYVDDEPDIREIAVMCLELKEALEVKSAGDGFEGVTIATEWKPDMVLLDVMMPGMDGPTTKQKLAEQSQTKDIPVVFVTARSQPSEIERFMSLGAKDVIAKPFDPMTFGDQVITILDR